MPIFNLFNGTFALRNELKKPYSRRQPRKVRTYNNIISKGNVMWKKDSKPRLLDSGVFEASKDQHCEIYLRDDSGSA